MENDRSRKIEMNPDDEPIIEDDRLPAMEDLSGSDVMGAVAEAGGEGTMSEPAPGDGEEMEEYPDMEPKGPAPDEMVDAASFAAPEHGEGYLRLVVSVEDNVMTVIDASVVEGPLVEEDLTGQMVYQAIVNDRRVSAGAFADLAIQSGFAPPDDESLGHSTTEITSYQFVVRIPRSEITLDELADLQIELVRPTTTNELSLDAPVARGITFAESAASTGLETPPVIARLAGVSLDDLPDKASEALRKGLR